MSLPTDWYIQSGEANHAAAEQHQFAQETAKLILEIMRQARLHQPQRQIVQEVELLDPASPTTEESSTVMDAQLLDDRPAITGVDLPVIEPELMPDRPALPSIQHRPEQMAADTVQILIDRLGVEDIYCAESYTIQRQTQIVPIDLPTADGATMQAEAVIYRMIDAKQHEIFVFRDAGEAAGYDILQDELGLADMQAILNARLGIEREKGLENIMTDPTFAAQVTALGAFAPVGAQAVNFAHYALDGYDGNTMKTPQYTMSRDAQGNVTIWRNPPIEQQIGMKRVTVKPAHTPGMAGAPTTTDIANNPTGQVLLRTEEGRVEIFAMSAKDQHNFAKMFEAASSRPLNRQVAVPTRVAKPQLSRD
jgi:hypothetical protein